MIFRFVLPLQINQMASWLEQALIHRPLNRANNSNIIRLPLTPLSPQNPTNCSVLNEITPSLLDTEALTRELLKRTGRVSAATENDPFKVAVRFQDGKQYCGMLKVIKLVPNDEKDPVVQIDFDDGDVELYSQKELYDEISG